MAKGLSKEQLLHRIMEAASPAAASFGLEIWGIELMGSGRPVARIFVDAPVSGAPPVCSGEPASESARAGEDDLLPPGVTVDQCAEISRMVGLALDVEELFSDAWVLEVSSPGLDRPFFRPEQLLPYVGRELEATLWEPLPDFPGRHKFRGALTGVNGEEFTLRPAPLSESAALKEQPEAAIRWDNVRKARLIPIFPDTSKPGQGKAPRSKSRTGEASGQGGGKKA